MATKPTLHIRQDIGSGDPIVLLHGMFGDGTQWAKIAALLAVDYRVIVVDLLGHGNSPRPVNATYSADEHVSYLRNTLESVKATQNLTVVGYSMGGAVALAYAKAFESEIAQLYLISTPFYLSTNQMIASNYAGSVLMTKASTGLFDLVERVLRGGKVDWAIRYANRSKVFHKMIGANENELEAEIVRKNLQQLVRLYNFAGNLKDLKVPTTFYAGKKDAFIVQGQLNALKQFNKNMHVQRLDIIKVDHMLVQNLPKQMAKLIAANKANTLHIGMDTGSGKPLVLLHGIESSSAYWRGVVPALAEHHRVIAIDLLGFGKSPKPLNVAYSLQDQVDWIKRTLNLIGVDRFDVAGHSLGSLVALALAADSPKRVNSLTMLSPVLVPSAHDSKNLIIKNMQYVEHLSDSSVVYSHIARAVGDKRIGKYLPSLRSVENAVKHQHAKALAQRAAQVDVTFAYGKKDPLVDASYVRKIANVFKRARVLPYDGVSHNFPLFKPQLMLEAVDGSLTHTIRPKANTIVPRSFAKQLVKLATPVLWAKSIGYIAVGLLLFSSLAPHVLTIGLSLYVINYGYKYIRGAFSLRNEHLSYIGYVLLGFLGVIVGYGLVKHPELSLKISVFVICALVLAVGLSRFIVALLWAKSKAMRSSLLLTGIFMTIAGTLALLGSLRSIYIIVYTVAVLLILRGAQFGMYAVGAFIMAYVRGFNK